VPNLLLQFLLDIPITTIHNYIETYSAKPPATTPATTPAGYTYNNRDAIYQHNRNIVEN
jgi:hypothetical protein